MTSNALNSGFVQTASTRLGGLMGAIKTGVAAFHKADDGNTAVEFSMIMPPFLLILGAILELSALFIASVVIEGATVDAGRLVRTGQVQVAGDPVGAFDQALCEATLGLYDCSDLTVDVASFEGFDEVDLTVTLDENGQPTGTGFDAGDGRDIVAVRVMYRWDFTMPLVGELVGTQGLPSRLMIATSLFRNEPFGAV